MSPTGIELHNISTVSSGTDITSTVHGPESPTAGPVFDLEAATPAISTINGESQDPLHLRSSLRTKDEVAEESKLRGRFRKQHRKVDKFYRVQNEHIETMLMTLENHAEAGDADVRDNALKVKIAIRLSFVANCALAVLQLYAAISSLSLSFFATAIDSVFDPAANLLLNRLHKKSRTVDLNAYPGGGARLTTIGNIVYAFAMLIVSYILVAFSVQSLAAHKPGEELEFHVPAVIAVGVAFVTKLCLFLYCLSIRGSSSQIQFLWQDHRNDLMIKQVSRRLGDIIGLGILTSSAGAKLRWWIDPVGAIVISVIIIGSWTYTSTVQFGHLAGKAAPNDFLQLVIYKAMTFSDEITQIDSCRAYHSGEKYLVEVDIVMPGNTDLITAHDVSQDLQDKLEALPMVERAYVHVDHEVSHKPEHRKYD